MLQSGPADLSPEETRSGAMPSANSDQEQGTAACEQQEEELDERNQIIRSKMEEQLSRLLGISSLMQARGFPDNGLERRSLAFLNMELTAIAASLLGNHAQNMGLLMELQSLLDDLVTGADKHLQLQGTDRGCLRILRTSAKSSRDWKPDSWSWIQLAQQSSRVSQRTCEYSHLPPPSSHPGLPHQVAEAAGLPLVGIEDQAKELLGWLIPSGESDSDTILKVIGIVGPTGIGKTTLARELRNHPAVTASGGGGGGRGYFQCHAMARASGGTELFFREILAQIADPTAPAALPSDQSQPETWNLPSMVSHHLQHKRYFIIIDDVPEASEWIETTWHAFPFNHGSVILITARDPDIPFKFHPDARKLVYEMKPLNPVDSETLLLANVFGVDGCPPDNVYRTFSDEILSRCEGIPLFINAMADLSREQFKQHQQELQECECDGDTIPRFILEICWNPQVPNIPEEWLEQALSPSYDDLPHDLKLLSLYMSMLPAGYKDHLIRKWIVEDLISAFSEKVRKSYKTVSAWEVGERSISSLMGRRVVTCVAARCKHNNLDDGEGCEWHMNHFMRQFLVSKSAEIGFAFTSGTLHLAAASSTSLGNEASRIPRRLFLHDPDPNIPPLLAAMDLSQTRSLAVSGTVSGGIIPPLDKFVNLVVLDLEGWGNLKDEDLQQLCRGKMFFLKYLSIRNTGVRNLPHEIKDSVCLETLDVSCTLISELPLEVFELVYLQHLDLRGTRVSQLPKQIAGLLRLTALLVDGEERIVSSETVPATRVPNDARHLCRLKTLATVDLTEQPATASFVRALGALDELEVLAITWSFHQSTDRDCREALVSSIEKWVGLLSLTIHCGLGCSMEFLGSSLSRPPRKLEKLKVVAGRFASVPRWISSLKWSLTFLEITVCKQGTDDLKILGGLIVLQCLILGLDFIPGEAVVVEKEGFDNLGRFCVECPMPWLTFSQEAMPNLTCLQLKFCATPAGEDAFPSGIGNLRRIREVTLCYDEPYTDSPSVKTTVAAVRKQVTELGNKIDLFINGIKEDIGRQVDVVTDVATKSPSGTSGGATNADAQAVDEEATKAGQCEITEA